MSCGQSGPTSSLLVASNDSRNFRVIGMNEMKKVPNQLPEKNGKAHVPFPSASFQTHLFSWYNISILFHGNMNSPFLLSLRFIVNPKVIITFLLNASGQIV